MIKVRSTVKLNMPRIRQLSQAAASALEKTGEALHTEVVQAQVVPRRDGALQGESFSVDKSKSSQGKVTLVHSTPYARRMYYHPEYKFHREPWTDSKGRQHDGNPNAKGHWFEDWEPGGKEADFAAKTFKKIYKREAGL